MQLKFSGAMVYINDSSPEATKIRQGFAYSFENGKLVVSKDQQTGLNREDLESKLEAGIASFREIQTILLHLLKKTQN